MARTKQTQTQRLRSLIKRQIKRMEKRGYEISPEIKQKIDTGKYQTLKSLQRNRYQKLYKASEVKAEGQIFTGTKYRAIERSKAAKKAVETRQRTVDFSDLAGTFDPETGEIFEPSDFYRRTGYEEGGTLSVTETSDLVIDNILEDFINKLDQDVPEYYVDNSGHRRYLRKERRDEIIRAKESLKAMVENEISAGRSEELAQRLQDNASEVGNLTDKLFSYDETAIGMAQSRLATIITGHALSAQEMSQLDASLSMSYGYNEPS